MYWPNYLIIDYVFYLYRLPLSIVVLPVASFTFLNPYTQSILLQTSRLIYLLLLDRYWMERQATESTGKLPENIEHWYS